MRRVKIRFSLPELHAALGLARDVQVLGAYTRTDPDLLFVVCGADWFNEHPDTSEAPYASLDYVRDDDLR